jgi:hypothetical protein
VKLIFAPAKPVHAAKSKAAKKKLADAKVPRPPDPTGANGAKPR